MLDRYSKVLSEEVGFTVELPDLYIRYQDELEACDYSWEKLKELALRERAIAYGNQPNRPPTEEELEGQYQQLQKEKLNRF